MKKKIFSLGNATILILFYLLFGVTYLSAILSDNFTIGDNLKEAQQLRWDCLSLLA